MAVTDANLVLGRLVPDYFPKIFGKSEKEPLDIEASRSAFEKLVGEINASVSEEKKMGMDEIVYGCGHLHMFFLPFLIAVLRFIKVANETMARPIRALTEARGYATSKHVYVSRMSTLGRSHLTS